MFELGNSYMFELYDKPCIVCNHAFPTHFATNGWRYHVGCVRCPKCAEEGAIIMEKPTEKIMNLGCFRCKHRWSMTREETKDRHVVSENLGI